MKPSKFDAVGDAYECQEEGAGASVSMWLSPERLRKADSWSYISSRKLRNWASAINATKWQMNCAGGRDCAGGDPLFLSRDAANFSGTREAARIS